MLEKSLFEWITSFWWKNLKPNFLIHCINVGIEPLLPSIFVLVGVGSDKTWQHPALWLSSDRLYVGREVFLLFCDWDIYYVKGSVSQNIRPSGCGVTGGLLTECKTTFLQGTWAVQTSNHQHLSALQGDRVPPHPSTPMSTCFHCRVKNTQIQFADSQATTDFTVCLCGCWTVSRNYTQYSVFKNMQKIEKTIWICSWTQHVRLFYPITSRLWSLHGYRVGVGFRGVDLLLTSTFQWFWTSLWEVWHQHYITTHPPPPLSPTPLGCPSCQNKWADWSAALT